MTSPRKHPTHGVEINADGPTIVFLTVCTKDRLKWLASEDVHDHLRTVWREATAWLVGRYVLMPDHLHLFAEPNESFVPYVKFDAWVRYWKSQFSKRHPDRECRWQTDHWDRRLRRDESYDESWHYVYHNPVRSGLVTTADQWPYQGEVHDLRWE